MNVRRRMGGGEGSACKPTDCYLRISRRHRRISGPIQTGATQQADKPLPLSSLFSTFPNINSNCSHRAPSAFQRDPVNVRIFLSPTRPALTSLGPECNNAGSNCVVCSCLGYGKGVCWRWRWWGGRGRQIFFFSRKVRVKPRPKLLCLVYATSLLLFNLADFSLRVQHARPSVAEGK